MNGSSSTTTARSRTAIPLADLPPLRGRSETPRVALAFPRAEPSLAQDRHGPRRFEHHVGGLALRLDKRHEGIRDRGALAGFSFRTGVSLTPEVVGTPVADS
jgi:hypothetical protein